MVTGIRWRSALPTQPKDVWHFIHRSDLGAIADAVVTIDGTRDGYCSITANDAARTYLDQVDDGTALTQITSRYTEARQNPVTLTLARREWRLTDLEERAQAVFEGALAACDVSGDLSALSQETQSLRRRLDELEVALTP